MPSPFTRWVPRSYRRWTVFWSLVVGVISVVGILGEDEDLETALIFGSLVSVATVVTFLCMRLWGRWRDRDPWSES